MSRAHTFTIQHGVSTRIKDWYVTVYVPRPGYSHLYLHPDLKLRGNMITNVSIVGGTRVYEFGYLKTRKQARQLIKDFMAKIVDDNIGQCHNC